VPCGGLFGPATPTPSRGCAATIARLRRHHRGGVPDDAGGLRLSTAQLVIAREYGFASWPG